MGLETVEVVLEIEERFGVGLIDERASSAITVGETHNEIVRLLADQGQEDTPQLRKEVWDGLVEIIARQIAIDPSRIKPESKWIGDITQDG